MIRAAFLDRDGVINQRAAEGEYITRWEDFVFLNGVVEAVSSLNQAGYRVIVVSNQRCIAKGLVTAAQVEEMHEQMVQRLARAGARIDAVYYCPHELEPVCRCRKPAPGMLLDAAMTHAIDLKNSWMIGDSEIDIEAGKNAGCRTVRIGDERELVNRNAADLIASSLEDAVGEILAHDRNRSSSIGTRAQAPSQLP
jgi:D-glycero-D-manno-heptose 1,7-bisphosphate phosphatase